MRSSSASSSTMLLPANSPTTRASGRPRLVPAAARHDEIDAERRAPVERRAHVLRTVADDRDLSDLDAELRQLLGEPRPVPIADPAAEHLVPVTMIAARALTAGKPAWLARRRACVHRA